jgi:hypothetical protein
MEEIHATEPEYDMVHHAEVEAKVEGLEDSPSTLDFFLSAQPDLDITRTVEVRRIGLAFKLRGISDEAMQTCMKRAEKRQTKMEKARGIAPERDSAMLEKLIIVEATVSICHRLCDAEVAKEQGKREWAAPLSLRDSKLLTVHGPRPEDFLERWLLPGERTQLADVVTDLTGFDMNALVDAAGN